MEKVNANAPHFSYLVTPRDQSAGGGWNLQLLQAGKEVVGGGAFPVTAEVTEDQAFFDATGAGEEWLLSKALQQTLPVASLQEDEQVGRFDRVTRQADGSFQHFYQGKPVAGPGCAATPADLTAAVEQVTHALSGIDRPDLARRVRAAFEHAAPQTNAQGGGEA